MNTHNFADLVVDAMKRKKSRIVVGLDPQRDHAPEALQIQGLGQTELGGTTGMARQWAIREFCERIIEATADIAVAFKVQIAFFEKFGSDGLHILERLLNEYEDMLFIIDGKRGDIGNTSEAYAEEFFHHEGEDRANLLCDAVTANPYLGKDSLEPYFRYMRDAKGVFVLCKTSNPSSADFQDLKLESGEPLYVTVARRVQEWGQEFVGDHGFSSLGLVVGATYPESARMVRAAAPNSLILVPGIGVQGGQLQDAAAFCDKNGQGALFNFSRSIIYAYKYGPTPEDHHDSKFAEAARKAAEHYREALNAALGEP
jgi:orotidine-5'-phosphate decarboxylase